MMTRTIVSALAIVAIGVSLVTAQNTAATMIEAARKTAVVDGDLDGAIKQYQAIVETYAKTDRAAAATALVRMAADYQKLGRAAESQAAYERVVREFSDQREAVSEARARLASVQSPAGFQSGPTARRIWAGKDKDFGPDVPSLDDRYWSATVATGDVVVRDLRTGVDRRVTDAPGDWFEYGYGLISPDGRQVAYNWYIHKENAVELRVASLAAGERLRPRTVFRADLRAGVYLSAWMPDGKQLLVLREQPGRTWQIGIVTIQDGSFRGIKSLEWRKPTMLSPSPDGRFIAYDVPEGEAGSPLDIFLLATDGRQEEVLQNPADDSFPMWSPDGSTVVFLSDRTGSNALWTVPIRDGRASGPASLVRSNVGAITPLAVTRSGTFYYRSNTGGLRNLFVTDLDSAQVTKTPVAGTERLVNLNVGPTWSRDGEHLAYYSFRDLFDIDDSAATRSTTTTIKLLVIRSRKTGEERTVPLPPRVVYSVPRCCLLTGPKWFPDNRSVLIESRDAQGAGFGFYRLAIDTGNTELLAHVPRGAPAYELSPDGRTIFYTIGNDDRFKLMRVDIETRRESELKSVPWSTSDITSIAVSPDGLQLAMVLLGGIVELMPAAGGQSREIFRPVTPDGNTGPLRQSLAWTRDQRFLLWVRGNGSLWKVPALGGQAEKVGLPMVNIKNLAVHPDGRQFVFDAATEEPGHEIWALENFLPR
jgi:Tol biopolymer transport system component